MTQHAPTVLVALRCLPVVITCGEELGWGKCIWLGFTKNIIVCCGIYDIVIVEIYQLYWSNRSFSSSDSCIFVENMIYSIIITKCAVYLKINIFEGAQDVYNQVSLNILKNYIIYFWKWQQVQKLSEASTHTSETYCVYVIDIIVPVTMGKSNCHVA